MNHDTTAESLRAILGDRLTTGVQDVGNGPQFVYIIDGTAYSLDRAAEDFLPKPEDVAEFLAEMVDIPTDPEADQAVSLLRKELGLSPSSTPEPEQPTVEDEVRARFGPDARIIGEDDMGEIAARVAQEVKQGKTAAVKEQGTGRPLIMLDSSPQMSLF